MLFYEPVVDLTGRIRTVLIQGRIPVIVRRPREPLLVRLPYAHGNGGWLRNGSARCPRWRKAQEFWEVPASWFNDLVDRCLERYGQVWTVQLYKEQEKCAPACLNAKGHECTCSCMGANHGAGNDGSWFEVSETFAVRTKESGWSYRLLTKINPLTNVTARARAQQAAA